MEKLFYIIWLHQIFRVECEKKACQYYFAVDGDSQIENKETLVHLIEANRLIF